MSIGNHILFILLTAGFIGIVALSKCKRPQGGIWSYIVILWNRISESSIFNRQKDDWKKKQTSIRREKPEIDILKANEIELEKKRNDNNSQTENENKKKERYKQHRRHAKKHVNNDNQPTNDGLAESSKTKNKYRRRNKHRTKDNTHDDVGQQTSRHHERKHEKTASEKRNNAGQKNVNKQKQNPAINMQNKHERRRNKDCMNSESVHNNPLKQVV